jgi:tetratricopeptide (TPR) repeat protein
MFCVFCGNSIIKIKQANDHADPAADPKIKNYLELAQNAMDSSDYDEAIRYYNKVLENNSKISEAWYGKGYCAGWSGNLKSIKVDQMILNYKNALKYTSQDKLQDFEVKIANDIQGCAFSIYKLSYEHTVEFAQVDGTYGEHLVRSTDVLFALEYAYTINPQSKSIVESILSISKNLLKPIQYKNYDDKWESLSLNSSSNKKIKDIYDKYFQIMEGIDPEFVNRIKKQEDKVKKRKLIGLVIAVVFVLFLFFKTCNGSNSQSNNDNFESSSTSYSEPNQTNTNQEEIYRQEQSNSSINDEPLLLQSGDNENSQLTKEIAKQLYLTFSEAVINENEQQLIECFSPNIKVLLFSIIPLYHFLETLARLQM